jgi:hypothetical protein
VTGGTGISVSGTTALTVSSTGVTSIVAGTNVSVSGATGAVTVNAPAYGTTITASTIGGTAAAGTSTSVAREDHKHAFPAGAAPSALTVSSTQATGTSASPALADHVHAMPGSATAGASAVGDTAATGTATTVALSDHRHSREAFGTPGAVTGGATAASGSATTIARSDHVHSTASMPVLLASTTLGSDAASYTFSSISSAFSHLQIVYMARGSDTTGAASLMAFQFNSDTSSNYRSSASTTLTNLAWSAYIPNANTLYSTQPAVGTATFYYYTDTTSGWAKRAITVWDSETSSASPSPFTTPWGMAWYTTNTAITAIKINISAGNFKSGSKFALYGYP